jgi:flavin-dependent dehydrogenase
MSNNYDAIVIGARCAGAPTAMLLARAGHRVLLLDRAMFPSDTLSTHVIHPPGVAALARWGLLERLAATGCPPIERYSFDFGPVTIAGAPRAVEGVGLAYCPRRTVLDALLVSAAREAGVVVREGMTVQRLLGAGGRVAGVEARGHGGTLSARAPVVIGADGRHSLVAKAVAPEEYDVRPSRMAMYYSYWSGLDVDGFATTIRAAQRRGWAVAPTHDGLTMVAAGWPIDEFAANKRQVERHVLAAFDLVPAFAERVRGARRVSAIAGTAEVGGYFRKPFGPGWALVGDAGYYKNPITAMGITDAFRDAELLARAVGEALDGRRSYDEAMLDYQRERDRQAMPVYEFTDEFARMQPPPPEMQQLLWAIRDDQDAMNDFVSVQAASLPAPEFFAPENLARKLGAAAAALRFVAAASCCRGAARQHDALRPGAGDPRRGLRRRWRSRVRADRAARGLGAVGVEPRRDGRRADRSGLQL